MPPPLDEPLEPVPIVPPEEPLDDVPLEEPLDDPLAEPPEEPLDELPDVPLDDPLEDPLDDPAPAEPPELDTPVEPLPELPPLHASAPPSEMQIGAAGAKQHEAVKPLVTSTQPVSVDPGYPPQAFTLAAVAHDGADGHVGVSIVPTPTTCPVPPDEPTPVEPPPPDEPVVPVEPPPDDDPPLPVVVVPQLSTMLTGAHAAPVEAATMPYGDRCIVVPDTVCALAFWAALARICHEPEPYVAARRFDAVVLPRLTEP